MLTPFFGVDEVRDFDSACRNDTDRYARFFQAMLERGVYLPPSPFEAWFVSLAHGERELDQTTEAARAAFRALAA